MLPFADRAQAGHQLGAALRKRLRAPRPLVLGLPRGGVPVAAAVAGAVGGELDVFVVRKLGVPARPELAMGAIASGGVRVLNAPVLRQLGLTDADVERVADTELVELQRREREYRGARPPVVLLGRHVVLVDDGLATGATMRAAVRAVSAAAPASVVVAVPVGAPEACELLGGVADEVLCLHAPPGFASVGQHYRDFTQTTDAQVQGLLSAG
jgi:putative phosphoribosyl transferase